MCWVGDDPGSYHKLWFGFFRFFFFLGLGGTGPDPAATKTLPDGVQVPLGNPIKTDVVDSSLLYNE